MVYRRTARSDEVRAAARARILGAARTLFTRDGYEATTMQQIVAQAGTSIGNAYFYFPNKERLLSELLELSAHQTWDATEAFAQSTAPGPTRVGAIIYANLVSMLGVDRDLARLLFLTDRRAGGVQIMREVSIARWLPHLAVSYPDQTAAEHELAATAIFGANRGVVERALSGAIDAPPARVARHMARWSLRALGTGDAEIEAVIKSATRRHSARTAAR
jgi:AcrR family transcriptional regulator